MKHPADFIKESLSEIWNQKQIGRTYDIYQHNVRLHTPEGLLYGREEVIRRATLTLAAFPGLSYAVEDVIAAQEAGDTVKVALRWTMTGPNTGYTVYGAPTGREVTRRGISHFHVTGDRIVEHWEVDNEIGVIRQLGFEPSELAVTLPTERPCGQQAWGEVERTSGQTTPAVMPPKTSPGFSVEDFLRRSRHEIWNWRLLGTIEEAYDEDAAFHGPSGRGIGDREAFTGFVLSLLSAFPDLAVFTDEVFWNNDGEGRYRTSVRWTLLGTHQGPGPYGPPTGKRVRVIGITNNVIQEGRIVEEWTAMGEFALLKQIHTQVKKPPEASASVDVGEDPMEAERGLEAENDTRN